MHTSTNQMQASEHMHEGHIIDIAWQSVLYKLYSPLPSGVCPSGFIYYIHQRFKVVLLPVQ